MDSWHTSVTRTMCGSAPSMLAGMQITTVDEAKQFYPLFGLGANVALIFSGRAVKYFSNVSPACSCLALEAAYAVQQA